MSMIMAPKRARPASRRKLEKASQERIKSDKYIHVHCFVDTGRWGAWVREPYLGGKRFYVGTHLTDRLAARCQDRALLKLETDSSISQPIKLNFERKDYEEDEHLRNTLSRADFFKLLRGESRASYKKVQKTECLRRFLAQEQALGNLPTSSSKGFTLQNSVNKKEYMTESIGESEEPPDHNDETSEEGDCEEISYEKYAIESHKSPGEGFSNVVPQSSTSFRGVQDTDSEATHENDELFDSVASAVTSATTFNWNGNRRRTSARLASDEKKAIEAMLLLSVAT